MRNVNTLKVFYVKPQSYQLLAAMLAVASYLPYPNWDLLHFLSTVKKMRFIIYILIYEC